MDFWECFDVFKSSQRDCFLSFDDIQSINDRIVKQVLCKQMFNVIQTMSRLPCFNENLLFFLNYLEQFKLTNKIEPGHFSTKTKFYVYSMKPA